MSTHRRIEVLCVTCAAIALLICTVMYVLRGTTGADETAGHQMGYEQTLFDTSKVHTIDIVMDDWDSFIASCESEEYAVCAVIVDGESFRNVGIRAKGNTSLSNVRQLGSQRYSFKIEFDQYESSGNYHGVDKLSLNNFMPWHRSLGSFETKGYAGDQEARNSACSDEKTVSGGAGHGCGASGVDRY